MKQRLLIFLSLTVIVALIFIPKSQNTLTIDPNEPVVLPIADFGERERQQDQPHLALQHDYDMMVDRNLGYVPTQRLIEATKTLKSTYFNPNLPPPPVAIQGVTWTERGPGELGGRSRSIMFDPNDQTNKKVWSGAVGGGLWFIDDITDPTAFWQQETDVITNLAISSLAYDPTNTQTFYMGTGQGYTSIITGAGIWKSTNGGDTWDQLASTINNDFAFVQRVKVNSKGMVFASTTSGLHKSVDGGNSWTEVLSGRFGDIDIASDGAIYATTGVNSTGGIFKSVDDGENWTDITPPNTNGRRTEIAVAPSNPLLIYAMAALSSGNGNTQDIAYSKKSEDGGDNWEDITIPLWTEQDCNEGTSHFTRGQAFFDLSIAVHPLDENVVMVGGIDTQRTFDGGETWQLMSYWNGRNCDDYVHADIHDIQFRPGDPNTVVVANDGGIDYSANAGNTSQDPDWERRVRGLNTVLLYYAATTNEVRSNVMLAGAQDNGTQRFTEAGLNNTFQTRGGDGGFCFINPNNPDQMIASFVGQVYDFSQDGGLSWSRIANSGGTGRFINPTDVDWDAGILYSAAERNQLTRVKGLPDDPGGIANVSIDVGDEQISAVKVSPYTANRVFVGTSDPQNGGRIFMVDDADGGTPTVTELTGNLSEVGSNRGTYLRSIDIGASDDQLLIAYSNFGGQSLFETTDGGTTWRDIEDNLPDVPVMWGIYNPNNRKQVLLATQMGAWSSNDITASSPGWEPSNEGLATTRIDHLYYRSADQMVSAATFGRGLFTTDIFATTVKADFKTDQTVGYVGVPVVFEDNSLLANDSYDWDFGDGNSSTLASPSHTYDTPGTYTVELGIDGGADVESKTNYITILPTLPADYTLEDGGNFESNPEHFTSQSTLHDVNLWERGTPGNALAETASGTNVWKTKLTEDIGNNNISHRSALYTPAFDFSAADSEYTLSFQMAVEVITCNLPIAAQMHYSLDGGKNWQTLGTSNGDPDAENWYNRGPNTSCAINDGIFEDKMGWANSHELREVRYNLNFLSGQPNVSFRIVAGVLPGATGGGGGDLYAADGFLIDDFQILATEPTADFIVDRPVGFQGDEFQFTYDSNGADSFLWDFGDGNTSTDEDPKHTYNDAGVFDVSLTVTKNGNPTELEKLGFVSIIPERTAPYELADGGDFESNFNDFIAVNNTGTPFELGVSSVAGKDGTASGTRAWVTGIDDALYVDDSEAVLVSPLIDFTDQAKIYTLEFKAKYQFEDTWDGFIIRYTIDRGQTWHKLNDNIEEGWYNTTSEPRSVFGVSVPIFSGNTGGEFETYSTDVTFLYPNKVAFQVLFLTDAGTVDIGMAFDDFQLTLSDADPPVAGFDIEFGTGCTGQEIVYTSTSTGTINSYEWDFGAGANPQTAQGAGPHAVRYINAGASTPSLTVRNVFGQSDTETKTDAVHTGAMHTPTFTKESSSTPRTERLVASTGEAYQWYLNSSLIEGATEQVYIATETGNYTVDVTVDGCTVRTSQQNIITSIEDDSPFARGISVYPNPVKDIMNLKVSNADLGELRIQIHTTNGVTVLDRSVRKSTFDAEYQISMASLDAGVYLVEVSSPTGKAVKRVVREE